MKVLAIIGSPKGKGNGYQVVTEIERQMKGMGEVEFEYLFLKDANLDLCQGCYRCAMVGEDQCPIKDDRALIEKKILAADGVILSSPFHMPTVGWPMKNFIDRFMYATNRPRFFGQKALLVATGLSTMGPKKALEAMRSTLGSSGMQIIHEMGIAAPPWPMTERIARQREKAVRAGAEKLYKACLDKKLPAPGFKGYLFFRLYKAMYTDLKEHMPLNYEFYRGKEYYYEAKVGPVTKLVAEAMASFAARMMRRAWS